MTSLTTYASIPYPVSTDQLVDYPSTAATAAQYVDPLPNTNVILNPAFSVQQRVALNGATTANPATGTYLIDGWRYFTDRTAGSANAIHDTSVQAIGDFGLNASCIQLTGTSMTHTSTGLSQRIADVRTLGGQTVTLSFYAKYTTTATTLATINIAQNFGTGGTPSSTVTTTVTTNLALTTSWTRYIYTFTIPSLSGKTLGTNNNSYLQLSFDVGNAAAYNFSIWGVMLEQRPTASRFVIPDIGTELYKCLRFYYEINGTTSSFVGWGFKQTTTTASIRHQFPIRMRNNGTTSSPSSPNFTTSAVTTAWSFNEYPNERTTSALPTQSSVSLTSANMTFTASTATAAAGTIVHASIGAPLAYLGWSSEL